MTTASVPAIHFFATYRRSASTTTAVTVVPSVRAFSTAASHKSVGMRSDLGIVGTSGPRRSEPDRTPVDHLAGAEARDDSAFVVLEEAGVGAYAALAAGGRCVDALDQAVSAHGPGKRLSLVAVGAVAGDLRQVVHFGAPVRRGVSTVCTRTYLHVNPFSNSSLERAA